MAKTPKNSIRPFSLPHSASRPVVTPLSPSVVYASTSPSMLDQQYEGELQGYTYAREGHPNADVLAQHIDALEGVEGGLVVGSGMAAITALFMGLLSHGDHVIAGDQLYGRSLRLLREDLPRFGIEVSFCDTSSAENVAASLKNNTKIVLVEAVSNPTLRVADVKGVGDLLSDRDTLFAIDNTFTTPAALKCAEAKADIIIHSVTKLLAGHSDVTLGYIWAAEASVSKAIYDFSVTAGLTPSPFDCWLAERGILSFPLRFERAQENAEKVATFLAAHPEVERVLYPTRRDHPDHNKALSLIGQNGCNMVSFELREKTRAAADRFTENAENLAFAPTLGDIGTTLSHPASSSHRALSAEHRRELGISEGFFRLSVGVESSDTLIEALGGALSTLRP